MNDGTNAMVHFGATDTEDQTGLRTYVALVAVSGKIDLDTPAHCLICGFKIMGQPDGGSHRVFQLTVGAMNLTIPVLPILKAIGVPLATDPPL